MLKSGRAVKSTRVLQHIREHSGHWMALAPEASVANDPIRTLAAFDASRFEEDYPSGLVVIINPPSGPSCLNCRGEALAS